jgi:hypothetical protein
MCGWCRGRQLASTSSQRLCLSREMPSSSQFGMCALPLSSVVPLLTLLRLLRLLRLSSKSRTLDHVSLRCWWLLVLAVGVGVVVRDTHALLVVGSGLVLIKSLALSGTRRGRNDSEHSLRATTVVHMVSSLVSPQRPRETVPRVPFEWCVYCLC